MPIRRLPAYDYTSAGAYFLTICTYRRRLLFLDPRLAAAVHACWEEIPSHFDVELDAFVAMPNHMHGILMYPRAGHARPLQTVVGSYKSAVTRAVNRVRKTPGERVWQRGYYERVIRNERELEALRGYIVANPAAWHEDPDNPSAPADSRAPWS